MLLMWPQFKKEYCYRASMSKCHRHIICQLIILSLTWHSTVHVHKAWAVAMAVFPRSVTLFWSKPHFFNDDLNALLFLSFFSSTHLLEFFYSWPSLLSPCWSWYSCPCVSCIIYPFYYFPLLASLMASVGLPHIGRAAWQQPAARRYSYPRTCNLTVCHVWRFEAKCYEARTGPCSIG